jgi:hypothetical protein
MITTAKAVTRQTVGTFALTGQPTHLVVRINGDVLEFREKGKRQVFRLPLEYAARQAVLHTAAATLALAAPPAPAATVPVPTAAPAATEPTLFT